MFTKQDALLLSEIVEMAAAMKQLDRAKMETQLAKQMCLMDYTGRTEELNELIAGMVQATPYPSLTKDNAMKRARKIAANPDPCDIDFDARTIRIASFANDEGVIEVLGEGSSPRARKLFFEQADKLGMNSNAKIEARAKRLEESPMFKAGAVSFQALLRADIEGEQAGHPLCKDCMVHHPEGKPLDKSRMH